MAQYAPCCWHSITLWSDVRHVCSLTGSLPLRNSLRCVQEKWSEGMIVNAR